MSRQELMDMSVDKRVSSIIKKYERLAYDQIEKKHYKNFYEKVCKINNVKSIPVEREEEWIKKWSGMGIKPNPIYYRLFSKYDGIDINIVPEDICRTAIEPCLNEQRFVKFYADKNLWAEIFSEEIFPPTIIRCMNGLYYNSQYNRIVNINNKKLIDILKKNGEKKYIVKPCRDTNSSQGVHTISYNSALDDFNFDNGEFVTLSNLRRNEGRNYVIQPFLEQHEYMSQFCSSSVNPIRICTYKSVYDDKVHVLQGAVLRIGYEGEETDGTHGNGMYVGINDDGFLKHKAVNYLGQIKSTFNGIDFNSHYQIPNFDKIKNLAVDIAEKVFYNRLLAFDIMLNKDGDPVIFELNNSDYSMWLAQFTGQPAFGKYTDEIIEYTKKNLNRIEHIRLY